MIFVGLILLSAGYAAAVMVSYGHPDWMRLVTPLTVAGLLAFYVDCRDLRGLRRVGGVGMFSLAFCAPAAMIMWLVVNDPATTGPALSFFLGYVVLAIIAAVMAAVGVIAVLMDL